MEKKEIIVGAKYVVGQRLHKGLFSVVFRGYDNETFAPVAIKLEQIGQKSQHLLHEAQILKRLQGGAGIPKLHWVGIQGDFCILITELLGSSLESLLNECERKFSVHCTLLIAHQLVLYILNI
eukprot:TRINITY_DN3625_c0_g1_i10.p2 TRINITY_DN3625_c0_g1~~TRINITY_DN3625_c0_g1_i10.p2  ORF type:complete len:123 (+),score=17.68 TRINITY_DN3625_c0_g1_i10:194-562(+)